MFGCVRSFLPGFHGTFYPTGKAVLFLLKLQHVADAKEVGKKVYAVLMKAVCEIKRTIRRLSLRADSSRTITG